MEQLSKLSPAQQKLARTQILQAILVDYFKLAVHVESRESSVYLLVIAKNCPKFKKATPGEIYPKENPRVPGVIWQAGWVVMAPPDPPVAPMTSKYMGLGAPIATLAQVLSVRLHTNVVDKTGLAGNYDFSLQFTGTDEAPISDSDSDSPWPPLFTAIQKQLGLKLDSGKGPVPVLVIDHAERPSGN